jgi:hypothetical protein
VQYFVKSFKVQNSFSKAPCWGIILEKTIMALAEYDKRK